MAEIKTSRVWGEERDLRSRWFKIFEEISKKTHKEIDDKEKAKFNKAYTQIITAHTESNRFYNTPKHLLDCLKEFDEVEKLATSPIAVQLALWFHRIVYDPKAIDNEAKSANHAGNVLKYLGATDPFIDYTKKIIQATSHRTTIGNIDEALAADIDFAMLGKPREIFNDTEQRIRRDYIQAPENQYRQWRKQILTCLLNGQIYNTEHFRQKYEAMARHNLEIAINNLGR